MSRSRDVLIPSGKRDAFIERRRRFTDNLKKKERNKLEKIQAIQTNTGSRTPVLEILVLNNTNNLIEFKNFKKNFFYM
jgi:hypothetical protein